MIKYYFITLIALFVFTACSISEEDGQSIHDIKRIYSEGIENLSEDPSGIMSYNLFKQAENNYYKNKINDTVLIADIYSQLGFINYNIGNYNDARRYLSSRYSLNDKIKDSVSNLVSQIKYAYTELELHDYQKAEILIDELTLLKYIPEEYKNNVIELEGSFYEILGDYPLAIDAFRGINSITPLSIRQKEYPLARNFYKLNQLDSARCHITRLIDSIQDTTSLNIYNYYILAANIFSSSAMLDSALCMYKMAEKFYDIGLEKTWNNKILDLEVKFDAIQKEREILSLEKSNYKVLIICAVLIILILALTLSMVIVRYKQKSNEIELMLKTRELENLELIRRVVEISLSQLPQVQAEFYSILVKNISQSSTALDEFNNLASTSKQKLKSDLETIMNSDAIKSINPVFHKIGEFTVNEKIIICLSFLKCPSSFIAKVLYTSTGSVRGMRARIKQKLELSTMLSEEEKSNILKIIYRDNDKLQS